MACPFLLIFTGLLFLSKTKADSNFLAAGFTLTAKCLAVSLLRFKKRLLKYVFPQLIKNLTAQYRATKSYLRLKSNILF